MIGGGLFSLLYTKIYDLHINGKANRNIYYIGWYILCTIIVPTIQTNEKYNLLSQDNFIIHELRIG